MQPQPGLVTELLCALSGGQREVLPRLVELVFEELHDIAKVRMRSEGHAHTLTPTALVNEAYLKLAGSGSLTFENRNHFFAIAGRAMRRILVDHARARAAARRGGRTVKPEVSDIEIPIRAPDIQIIALDDALQRLAEISPRQCQVVELRYFVGMSETEVAEILGVTRRTVDRDWKIARAWLHSALNTL